MSGHWSARAAALTGERRAGRGARLLSRIEGGSVRDVTSLAAVPAWLVWPESRRRRMAATVALLHHRPALDRELRAEIVAPLAALTGEGLFDAICAAPEAGNTTGLSPLPSPARLGLLGERLLNEALPPALGGAEDAYAVRLAQLGESLVLAGEGA